MALLSSATEGEVIFWNQAAQGITGYAAMELLAQTIPEGLKPLLLERNRNEGPRAEAEQPEGRRALVRARHKLGHGVPVISRTLALRDALGERIGAVTVFHPALSLDALPHSETGEDPDAEESRAELEERLQTEFDDFARGGQPFGVLWIAIDQAEELRKTHGAGAYRTMVDKMRHALAQGLRPAEEMGALGRRRVPRSVPRAQRGDARGARANPGRAGEDRGLPLVGRSRLAHREHRRGTGCQQ